MKFRVRSPLSDYRRSGLDIEATGPLQAAEAYARKLLDDGDIDGTPELVDISVRDEAGEVTEWSVAIDWTPTFRARLQTGGPT